MSRSTDSLDQVNQFLSARGYDPNARVDTGVGVRNFTPTSASSGPGFFDSIRKSAAAIPGAVGAFGKSIADPFVYTAGFLGKVGESQRNAKKLAGMSAGLNSKRSSLIKDFHSHKISAKEFSKRLDELNNSTEAKQYNDLNKYEAGAEKKFNTKDVAINYGKVAATTLTAAAPFATAAAPLAEGAGALAKVGNVANQGLDAYFGAGNMIKPGSVPATIGRTALKVGGMGLDIAANNSTISDLSKGKVDPINTGLTAAGFVPGGPLGLAEKFGSTVAGKLSKSLYAKEGIFDKIPIKGGTILSQAEKISDPKQRARVENTLKQVQDFLIQQHGTPRQAVKEINQYIIDSGAKSLDDVMSTLSNFTAGGLHAQQIQRALEAGKGKTLLQGDKSVKDLLATKGGQLRAGKFSAQDSKKLSSILKEETDGAAALERIKKEIPQVMDNARNRDVITQGLADGIKEGTSKAIQSKLVSTTPIIDKATGKPVMLKGGYHLFYTPKEYATFKKAGEVAPLLKSSRGKLAPVGAALDKMGLSTKSANPQEQKAMFRQVRNAFEGKINDMGVVINGETVSGKKVLTQLNDMVEKRRGMTDIRQLGWRAVAKDIGVSDKAAKSILKEYKNSFDVLSRSERGLAGKFQDLNLKYNPIAGSYSRIQSLGRYEVPWFRVQENIETKLGVAMASGAAHIPGRDYTDTIDAMKNTGMLRGAGYGGQGAGEFGNITAKLSRGQQKDLAAGLESLAGSRDKMAITKFIKDNPDMIENLRTIVQYPDKGLTSSNLMKGLNLVAFPVRYNAKVTQFALKQLAKEPGVRQMAVLSGFRNFENWQKTPEGIKWSSDNKEALGLIRYFTPIGSIESTYKLLSGDIHTLRDIGTIGGLPLGFISAVLQGQGIKNFDSPYLDPKTGEVVPTKVPQDLKARAAQALSDIIGTMFTFPGRIISDKIPSKKDIQQTITDTVTLGQLKGGKYKSVTRTDLTDQQRREQAVLQAGKAKSTMSLPKSSSAGLKPLTSTMDPKDYIKPIYKTKKTRARRIATPLKRP